MSRAPVNWTPLVSVVICFLNAEKFLQESIDSALAQRYKHWELLLVDDGSTDRSTEIALRYAHNSKVSVRYLEHCGHQNRGLSASRNLGISHATGELIAILDSDDVWLPHKLEQQVAIMASNSELAMVYGQPLYWHSWTGRAEDAKRDFKPEPGIRLDAIYRPPELLILQLRGMAASPCPSDLLLRREAILRLGGFEEAFKGMYGMYEDQAFLAKMYLREAVFVSSQRWDYYRIHPDSLCAVQARAGTEHSIRLFYLNWLEQYLRTQRVSDPAIWKPILRMRRPFHYPRISRVGRYLRSLAKIRGITIS